MKKNFIFLSIGWIAQPSYTHFGTTALPRGGTPVVVVVVVVFRFNERKRWENSVPRSIQEKLEHLKVV